MARRRAGTWGLLSLLLMSCSGDNAGEPRPTSTVTTLPYSGPELYLEAAMEDGFWCTRVVDTDGLEYLERYCFDARSGLGVDAGEIRFHRGGQSGDWVVRVYVRGAGVTVLNGGSARVESGDPTGFVVWSPRGEPGRATFWTEFDGVELECWYVNVSIRCIDR